MSAHSLATRYGKSLLGLAQEKGKLEEVFKDVKAIDSILENHRDLKMAFKSPIIPTDKKLTIIRKIFEGNVNDMTYKFMELVTKKRRESDLHDIFAAFITQYNVIKGITPVKLTSAVKLDAPLVQNIINSLKVKEKLATVELRETVDEDIIGGFILQYDDKMLDNSVSRSLNNLKTVVEDDTYIKKYS